MKLIIASNNKHKIREIKDILGDRFDSIISLSEAGIDHETVEDGVTFVENARKKAREICDLFSMPTLADDSGICVDHLGGAPGIYSARFAGEHGNDKLNNACLLKKLEGVTDRKAHYTCAMVIAYPDGSEVCAEGYMHGSIGYCELGQGGFGYDPLFIPLGLDKTLAEITEEEKNKISHRKNALEALLNKL